MATMIKSIYVNIDNGTNAKLDNIIKAGKLANYEFKLGLSGSGDLILTNIICKGTDLKNNAIDEGHKKYFND